MKNAFMIAVLFLGVCFIGEQRRAADALADIAETMKTVKYGFSAVQNNSTNQISLTCWRSR